MKDYAEELYQLGKESFNAFIDNNYTTKIEHQKMITTYEGRITELQSKIEGLENEINGLKSVNELLEQENRTKNTKYNNAMCSIEEQLAINIKDKNTILEQQKDIDCIMTKISNLERQLQVREDTQYTNFQPKNLLPHVLISTSEKVLDRVVFEVKLVNKTPTHHDLIFENEGAKERFKAIYDCEVEINVCHDLLGQLQGGKLNDKFWNTISALGGTSDK